MESTRLREERLSTSWQGEIIGCGHDIQNRDDSEGEAEKGEHAITEDEKVSKGRETLKNTDGELAEKAQRIMRELDESRRKAKKMAELHLRLEQRESKMEEKHMEAQRALEEQLKNKNAEIDHLQEVLKKRGQALSVALQDSEGKDKMIIELQTSVDGLRQADDGRTISRKGSDGFFTNIQAVGDAAFNDFQGDVHHYMEGRGNGCLLLNINPLISLTGLDEVQISEDAIYDSLAHFYPSLCHPGTCDSVLNAIADWVDEPDPKERILWVNGFAGTGKSTIAQTIIKRYKDSRIAATFFFLNGHADCGNANRAFTTLAWQLAKSIPETHSHIESVLDTERFIHTATLNSQFDRLFVKLFESLPYLRPEKSLIVIDGIDECSSKRHQKLLLMLIGDALARRSIPLRFIVFSRPEAYIKEIFSMETLSKITHTLSLDEYAPEEDIGIYLMDEFHRTFTRRKVPLPSDENINRLASKASGQFIFASTAVKFIDDDAYNPQDQLEFVLPLRPTKISPSALMDQLYIRILSQQEDTKMLKDLFVLLIALGHPKLSLVSRRLGISEKQLRLKLHAIRALLRITESSIGVYHRSLHDFFQDRQRADQYYIHPMRVNLVQLSPKGRMFWGKVHRSLTPNFDKGLRVACSREAIIVS